MVKMDLNVVMVLWKELALTKFKARNEYLINREAKVDNAGNLQL